MSGFLIGCGESNWFLNCAFTSGGTEDAYFLGFAGVGVSGIGDGVTNRRVKLGADNFWFF